MHEFPIIATPRARLEILGPKDADLMVDYYASNKVHLAPWEPLRGNDFFTVENWREVLQAGVDAFHAGTMVKFSALAPDRSEVVGVCNFSCIVYRPFWACNLGYSIAAKHEGHGLMYEIVDAAIGYMFNEAGLHRVMANYIPTNHRSATLLRRLGFHREGFAKAYMQIAGRWQDHVLTSKTNDQWEEKHNLSATTR